MPNSTTLCIDASIVSRMLGSTPSRNVIDQFDRWQGSGNVVVAPLLLRYEVANALRQMRKQGQISWPAVEAALQALIELPINVHSSPHSHATAMRYAERFNLPATYDAHYLALAEELDGEFWTADRRLARAVQHELGWVHLFE